MNECQNDLGEQLTDFKHKVQEKVSGQEVGLNRMIERKIDHKEVVEMVNQKMDKQEGVRFVDKQELLALRMQLEGI